MRLVNINTYELGEFIGTPEDPIPPYVILSHTWGENEVTYNEMMSPTSATLKKDGYIKIQRFAEAVALWNISSSDAIEHVWVDTCCMGRRLYTSNAPLNRPIGIDKTSSAELSEAINAMYRWYKHAKHCYVYLSDVAGFEPDSEDDSPEAREKRRNNFMRDALASCRWMTRGWSTIFAVFAVFLRQCLRARADYWKYSALLLLPLKHP